MTLPLVGIIMGSRSDWETLQGAAETLQALLIAHEVEVVSAHLPGMMAAKTLLPVLGVPVQSRALNGMDSLLSIVQMPAGIPVGTLAIGAAGAVNAALLAAAILSGADPELRERLRQYRAQQSERVLEHPDPRQPLA